MPLRNGKHYLYRRRTWTPSRVHRAVRTGLSYWNTARGVKRALAPMFKRRSNKKARKYLRGSVKSKPTRSLTYKASSYQLNKSAGAFEGR